MDRKKPFCFLNDNLDHWQTTGHSIIFISWVRNLGVLGYIVPKGRLVHQSVVISPETETAIRKKLTIKNKTSLPNRSSFLLHITSTEKLFIIMKCWTPYFNHLSGRSLVKNNFFNSDTDTRHDFFCLLSLLYSNLGHNKQIERVSQLGSRGTYILQLPFKKENKTYFYF